MKRVQLQTAKGTLCVAEVADNPWTKFWGLMGRKSLGEGHGMWIRPCTSVHTWFMQFPLDVVYLTREGSVAKAVKDLRPFRFSLGGGGAYSVIELSAGALDSGVLQVGDAVEIASGDGGVTVSST